MRLYLWVAVTFGLLMTMQAGPSVLIIVRDDLGGSLDWAGFIGYTLGSVALPMAVGCIGLLFKPHRGIGFLVASIVTYALALFGNIAG